jgi:hypothetical protein
MATTDDTPPRVRPLLPQVRVLLTVFCALTAAGFLSLFAFASRTEETFAWTINPPVTAAFMGSGYGAGFMLSLLSLRARTWADVRIPYLTVLVFTSLTTVATFLHLDRLHFTTPGTGAVAELAGWFWTAVYVVIPVAMAALLWPQERSSGVETSVRLPLPAALKAALAVQGAVLLVVGLSLFLAPTSAERLWAWPLTPLTARTVAAWLLAFAFAAFVSLRVDDLARLRTAALAYAVLGALLLVTLARFASQVAWQGAVAWILLAGAVAMTCTGSAGWLLARRGRTPLTSA